MELKAKVEGQMAEILTPDALAFVEKLVREFEPTRATLLALRIARQKEIDNGAMPDFLAATKSIREDKSWRVASIPADLQDRRTEITGPVDRKMVINALNSGAKVFMADFEDATSPTWENLIEGQLTLRDAVRRTITYPDPATKKQYKLNDKTGVLFVRARGWHLEEQHVRVDGEPMSGSIFDFGLY